MLISILYNIKLYTLIFSISTNPHDNYQLKEHRCPYDQYLQ